MTELTKQVAAGDDDGYAYPSSIDATNYIFFGHSGASSLRSFHRFTNVTIPAGATITAAKLQFRCAYERSGTCNVKAHFEAADNPSAPTTYSDLTSRSLTTGTAWSSVALWTVNNWYDSVDIKSELQEVINRAGWSSGNAVIAHVVDNSSSSGAQRQSYSYNNASASAAKLVVNYTTPVSAELTDQIGTGDAAEGFSLTDSMSDAAGGGDAVEGEYYSPFVDLTDSAGAGDAVEGYDFSGIVDDAAGAGDSTAALAEADGLSSDAAGIGDSVLGSHEAEASLADASAISDEADGLNWTSWQAENRDRAVIRYYCTLTGADDSTTDIEIPISSFSASKRTDQSNYLSVVVPGYAYANQISARPSGDLYIEMAYVIDSVESLREEIIRVDLEQITPQIGPRSRSITLIGHRDAPNYDARSASMQGCNYKYSYDGSLGFRFPQADPYLNPGDALTVVDTDDQITVNYIAYSISARGTKLMEVREG